MLTITVKAVEMFDESKNEFVGLTQDATIDLEHSLVSLSKWESKWEKPFLGASERSDEEALDYVRCMTLTPNVPPEVYTNLGPDNVKAISEYINAKMSATWFGEERGPVKPGQKEIVTAEIIYYWMTALSIPFTCEEWHLNRLLTLVKVCNRKNTPPDKAQKMAPGDAAARRRALNAERKAKLGTAG